MSAISEETYTPNFAGTSDLNEWLKSKFPASEDSGKWKVTRFETTPPMSSYLVAYANGPFKHIEGSYKSPLSGKVRPLRVYGMNTYLRDCPKCSSVLQPPRTSSIRHNSHST